MAHVTKVWQYGMPRGITERAEEVEQQFRLMRKYRNGCIQVLLEGRAEYRQITSKIKGVSALDRRIAKLRDKIQAIRDTINGKKIKKRKRDTATEEERAEIDQLEEAISKLYKERRSLVKGVLSDELDLVVEHVGDTKKLYEQAVTNKPKMARDEKLKKALRNPKQEVLHRLARAALIDNKELAKLARFSAKIAAADMAVNEALMEVYRQSECFWGTKLIVNQAINKMRVNKTDPVFKKWDGSGAIGVQLSKGRDVDEVVDGSCTMIRIEQIPQIRYTRKHPEGREIPNSALASLRIGSDGRDPVWAKFPVIAHRPIPPGSRIKWAKVVRRRVATGFKWELQLTVEIPLPKKAPTISRPKSVGAMVFGVGGYASVREGSVATVMDLEGEWEPDSLFFNKADTENGEKVFRGRLVVGADRVDMHGHIINRLQKASSLRGIRDDELNKLKDVLIPWYERWKEHLSKELQEELQHVHKWRSPRRPCKCLAIWSQNRVRGDRVMFKKLSAYCYHDNHLWEYQANQERNTTLSRREAFRVYARYLERKYEVIVFEKEDFSKRMKNAAPEDPAERRKFDDMHYLRRVASPGILRECVKHAFGPGRIVELPMQTSPKCPACGAKAGLDIYLLRCGRATCGLVVDKHVARIWKMLRKLNHDTSKIEKGVWAVHKLTQGLKGN